jgi:hypothetical protein
MFRNAMNAVRAFTKTVSTRKPVGMAFNRTLPTRAVGGRGPVAPLGAQRRPVMGQRSTTTFHAQTPDSPAMQRTAAKRLAQLGKSY